MSTHMTLFSPLLLLLLKYDLTPQYNSVEIIIYVGEIIVIDTN